MKNKKIFKVGDIVRLKSGGPSMTVKKYFESTEINDAQIVCQWFAGDKLQVGTFCLDSVEVEEDISTE